MENLHHQWYVLLVKGGTEEKVIANIKEKLEEKSHQQWKSYVSDLKSAKLLKGHIFCYCLFSPQLLLFFSKIEGVRGFLNYQRSERKLPEPISSEVVSRFFSQSQEKEQSFLTIASSNLNIGDLVKITRGTFLNCKGKISYLDNKKQKVKIIIENKKWEITDMPIDNCQKIIT